MTVTTNGAAMAAVLASATGSFAMAAVVLLNEARLLVVPALYGPAGGVSSRTTLAVAVWLLTWGALHTQWRSRDVAPRPVFAASLVLIVLAIAGTFPPVWSLL